MMRESPLDLRPESSRARAENPEKTKPELRENCQYLAAFGTTCTAQENLIYQEGKLEKNINICCTFCKLLRVENEGRKLS